MSWARRGLAVLAAVGALEFAIGLFAYRDRPNSEDFAALAAHFASAPAPELVVLADDWLGPLARMHVPALADLRSAARPDLRGVTRVTVVGLSDDWTEPLARELEDMPPPRRIASEKVGPFRVATWEHARPSTLHDGLIARTSTMRARTDEGACRGRGEFRCPEGNIAARTVEVDYRPRRCLALNLRDGARLELELDDVTTGTVLRGHVGFGDFNARLRQDAPIRVEIAVDGEQLARWTVADAQGWWPFAVTTTPGRHRVTTRVFLPLSGTWQGTNYDSTPTRSVCLEWRTLSE